MELLAGYGSDASNTSDESLPRPSNKTQSTADALPAGFFEDSAKLHFATEHAEPAKAAAASSSQPATGKRGDISSAPAFNKLPTPKTSRVATFRVPINLAALADSDEDDAPKLKRAKTAGKGAKLTAFLPAPKHADAYPAAVKVPPSEASPAGHGNGAAPMHSSYTGNEAYAVTETNDMYAVSNSHPDVGYQEPDQEPDRGGANGQQTAAEYVDQGAVQYGSADVYAQYQQQDLQQQYYQQEGASHQPYAGGGGVDDAALVAALAAEGKSINLNSIQIKEVDQRQLTYMDPSKKAEMQGVAGALGPAYAAQLRQQAGPAPSRMAKRKHQIGTLYHQAKAMELELLQKGAKANKTKAETQGKYGW